MHRSHRLSELLNYFPENDVRVRELPYTIDAQLLNGAATQLEDAELRLRREIDARTLATTPIHVDNRGLYQAVRLENELALADGQTSLTLVEGFRQEQWMTLTPFDDRLPIPAAYERDPSREAVPLSNPVVWDVTGAGDAQARVWAVHASGSFALPIPNPLTFYVEGTNGLPLFLTLVIEGEAYPASVWPRQRRTSTESVVRTAEGVFTTTTAWSRVDQITVRGLPLGARLRCWTLPVNLPAVPDPARPCALPAYRDRLFERYWTLDGQGLLTECFLLDSFSGLSPLTTYGLSRPLAAVVVEPRTWGLLAAGGAQLTYVDRREPLPGRLDVTALTAEPLYGLSCEYNYTIPGAARYLYVRPVPYGSAKTLTLWRYLIEDPVGNLEVLLPNGCTAAYSGGAGWQRGEPTAVNVPLVTPGTYVITIECRTGQNSTVFDSAPYPHLSLGGASYDLSALVPEILGVAYDSRENLWVWTGDFAVPLRPRYDNYLLDATSRTLYLTSDFDAVRYL